MYCIILSPVMFEQSVTTLSGWMPVNNSWLRLRQYLASALALDKYDRI